MLLLPIPTNKPSLKLKMVKIIFIVVVFIIAEGIRNVTAEQNGTLCTSQQYVELGRPGTLHCDFGQRFLGVFWYNSTDYLNEQQLIYITNEQKGGAGYLSGEFDILPNGSLAINNVTLQHNHGYTVIMFRSKTDETVPIYVNVVVTVKPKQTFPTINECDGEQICFRQLHVPTMLYCYVNDSLPAINLTFARITSNGDQQLESALSVRNGKSLQTSVIGTDLLVRDILTLYVCKADAVSPMLNSNEAAVLVQTNVYTYLPGTTIIQMFAERSSNVELKCSHNPSLYLVWSRQNKGTVADDIGYSLLWHGQTLKEIKQRYEIVDNSSLLIAPVTVHDEGIYQCLTSDGITEEVDFFNVTVFVTPDPYNLVVDGCNLLDNCVLSVKRTGRLTCSLRKTRPVVSLEWQFVSGVSGRSEFHSQAQTVEKREDSTYDIVLSAEYHIDDGIDDTVTAECSVMAEEGMDFEWLNWSMQINLLVPLVHEPPQVFSFLSSAGRTIVILACVLVTTVLSVFAFIMIRKKYAGNAHRTQIPLHKYEVNEEEVSMITDKEDYSGKLNTFRLELTKKYQEICETTKLLPNDSKEYCVDDVFIESGLAETSTNSFGGERWTSIESYHELITFTDTNRVILQGDSGFGKTLLCRKMAYDWYSKRKSSPFGIVDILIYIPVRLLGRLSLCVAIKQHLLPCDTTLQINDIKRLLSTHSSVLIFDGFSSFPRDEIFENCELHLIFSNKAFQRSHAILTTLPDFLPPKYKSTKRVKLLGFSEAARKMYINSIVAKNDSNGRKAIHSFLQSNPALFQFCQVPLFFALLSNLWYKGKIHNLKNAKRVTDIFESIVSGLSVHDNELSVKKETWQGNKQTDLKLERECFELLSKHRFRFDKIKLVKNLGESSYREYIKMGLLNEEENVIPANDLDEENISLNYRTEVRYYHSIFLEWYAAQHLSRIAENEEPDNLKSILDNIKPENHQYVFRFACGRNEKAALNIVRYLKGKEDGNKFAQICIVEQTGGIEKIRDTIEKLCTIPVVIKEDDSVLQQRSLVQLLDLASKNNIRIELLWFHELALNFNNAQTVIELGSRIQLPVLDTLQQISIFCLTKLTIEDFAGILTYASLCKKLKSIRLRGCLLPKRMRSKIMEDLKNNHVSVEWILPTGGRPTWRLNLSSGVWEMGRRTLTQKEYKDVKRVLFNIEE